MRTPGLDFPPLSPRQRKLLEELQAEIENLRALPPTDSNTRTKLRKKIDEFSVKVLRFALKPLPAETRRRGFFLEARNRGGRLSHVHLEVRPGFGVFHPDLPTWAKDHLIEWIQMLPLQRLDAREVLRETGIVAIETGVKPPEDLAEFECWELIKHRVLELRGVKDKESGEAAGVHSEDATQNEVSSKTIARMLDELRRERIVTDEFLKIEKQRAEAQKEKGRTRKDYASWNFVINKLVEEGLLTKRISRQAFKKMLKHCYPGYPWDRV